MLRCVRRFAKLSYMKAKNSSKPNENAALTRLSISGCPVSILDQVDVIAKANGRSRASQIRIFLAESVRQRKSA